MDLGLALDAAKPQIDSLLATSGCTVHLRHPVDPAGATADPATLTAAATPNPPYVSSVPAVVVEEPGGGADGQPARTARAANALVVIPAGVDVTDRVEVVVGTCRDVHLLGRVYAVTSVRRNASGIVTVLDAEPVRGS